MALLLQTDAAAAAAAKRISNNSTPRHGHSTTTLMYRLLSSVCIVNALNQVIHYTSVNYGQSGVNITRI